MARYFVVVEMDGEKAIAAATRSNVVGIYRKPSTFCSELNHGKQRGFRRWPKLNWWICGQCGRPSKPYWDNAHENSNLGRNLLEHFKRKASHGSL